MSDQEQLTMRALLDNYTGERLDLDRHKVVFEQDFFLSAPNGFWKAEARQSFIEPYDPSWQLFDAGRFAEAVLEIEARRSELRERAEKIRAAGFTSQRVRMVVSPLVPYLWWEFLVLVIRDELGMPTRVIDLDTRSNLGRPDDWPEVVTCGDRAAYELLYNEDGLQVGSIRYTDPELISECRRRIAELYQLGEGVQPFFDRKVAHLLPL